MTTDSPKAMLAGLVHGSRGTQMVHIAAQLGIADLLRDGPRSVGDLASAIGVDEDRFLRTLRGMVVHGLLLQREDGRFELTETGALLRTDRPDSMHDYVMFRLVEYRAMVALLHTIRTGQPAFDHTFGKGFFDYCRENAEHGSRFNRLVGERTQRLADAIVEAYDFSTMTRVVDIGGGNGTLLSTILRANPHLTGVLFDLEGAISDAKARMSDGDLAGRCELLSGSFFESIPRRAGTFVMKSILHDWDDERCARILENCHRAIEPGSKLLIIERLIPQRVDRLVEEEVESDLWLMAMTGGRERTEAEFASLLNAAGFRLDRIIPTSVRRVVLECVRRVE